MAKGIDKTRKPFQGERAFGFSGVAVEPDVGAEAFEEAQPRTVEAVKGEDGEDGARGLRGLRGKTGGVATDFNNIAAGNGIDISGNAVAITIHADLGNGLELSGDGDPKIQADLGNGLEFSGSDIQLDLGDGLEFV